MSHWQLYSARLRMPPNWCPGLSNWHPNHQNCSNGDQNEAQKTRTHGYVSSAAKSKQALGPLGSNKAPLQAPKDQTNDEQEPPGSQKGQKDTHGPLRKSDFCHRCSVQKKHNSKPLKHVRTPTPATLFSVRHDLSSIRSPEFFGPKLSETHTGAQLA